MFKDVQIIESNLQGGGRIAIIRGGFNSPNPKEYMDNVVIDYVQNHLYNEFIEEHLDNPYVRVIITGIDELSYYSYDKRKGLYSI